MLPPAIKSRPPATSNNVSVFTIDTSAGTLVPVLGSPFAAGRTLGKLVSAGEAVTVPAGSYKSSKIEIRVFENGQEMKDAHFTMYFANNAARTPVLLEAIMPFATAQVQLVHAK